MLDLVLERGGCSLLRRPISQAPITIGRSPDSSIVLTDPDISRRHCVIEWRDGALFMRDLSSNGTLVNGSLSREAQLTEGDSLCVGTWKLSVESAAREAGEQTVVSSPCPTKVVSYDAAEGELTTESLELSAETPGKPKVSKRMTSCGVVIGAHPSCDLIVSDPYVSRRHCELSLGGGTLTLVDLGSTNGTYSGSKRISRVTLCDSGCFTVGRSVISYRVVKRKERILPAKGQRLGRMIGSSRLIRENFALIERVAPSDATVCIAGESGTGKELVAREIHDRSARRRGPFVAVNCGALPPSIIEGQLFGHERGAFTGATDRSMGLIEQARGGTLFLDEIGEMPTELQTRLLRVLESRTLRRIGSESEVAVDVRFVAATNRDLKAMVREGKFREDLFFRLYVVPVHIAPLKDRPEDIEALALHFTSELSRGKRGISQAALARLASHRWPGNARELKNTIERSLLLSEGDLLEESDLRIESVSTISAENADLRGKERAIVAAALEECGGNLSRASKKLGIARTTLQKKIKRYAVDVPGREASRDA